MPTRLPMHARTAAEVRQYYETRARQFWHEGFRWDGTIVDVEHGCFRTEFTREAERYVSYYIPEQARGNGIFRKLLANEALPVITTRSCNIADILEHIEHPFIMVASLLDSIEYRLISSFYQDRRAERSQAFLMNHIDEGIAVMRATGASDLAIRAYCLHPLVQGDAELQQNFKRTAGMQRQVEDGNYVFGLAMEYRNTANAYLARVALPPTGVRLSPLTEVNAMLIGDKVQNRKDFEKFHAQTHPNRARLAEYFSEWLTALGVSELRYQALVADLPSF